MVLQPLLDRTMSVAIVEYAIEVTEILYRPLELWAYPANGGEDIGVILRQSRAIPYGLIVGDPIAERSQALVVLSDGFDRLSVRVRECGAHQGKPVGLPEWLFVRTAQECAPEAEHQLGHDPS